ncbi:hypothetical protein XJ44_02950 [Thermosipho affectus]|uniref:Outer membrane protein n=1 Tax=Thermosipho affectus TaxID=660294 RepID=A0ABX3IK62_9BACT|nr:hypothetical protein [Thermosipho affectus]ONN27594.1 hypothetical protein XJ44_02950 [Thermosipho affectus]
MVKKAIFLILLLPILSFQTVIIKSDYNFNIKKELFESNNLVVIEIFSVEKEITLKKVINYIKDEKGHYITYNGNYYYTNDKKRYNLQDDKFVVDKNGIYVYATNFPWARDEHQKYIISDFYRKEIINKKEEKYYVSGYLTEIDSFYIKSFTPFVFKVKKFDEVEKKLLNLKKNKNNFYSDKYDVVVNFSNTQNKLKAFIMEKLQQDKRYNIYDRDYIREILKDVAIKDLFGEISFDFRVPKYIINIKTINFQKRIMKKDLVDFFPNEMSGRYLISGEKVELGRYYKEGDDNSYILDKKEGNYVKILNFPWRKERFKLASNFYDLFFVKNVEYINYHLSILLNIIDTKNAKIIFAKTFKASINIPQTFYSKRLVIRNEKIEKINNLFKDISKAINKKLKEVFYLSSVVKDVKGLTVFLYDGENIGIKKGQVFRIFNNHLTQGYIRIKEVGQNNSNGNIFRSIEPIGKYSLAMESFYYPSSLSFSMIFEYNDIPMVGAKINFLDLYGSENYSILFGFSPQVYYIGISKRIYSFDFSVKLFLKETEYYISPEISITSFKRKSKFLPIGSGISLGINLLSKKLIFGYESSF